MPDDPVLKAFAVAVAKLGGAVHGVAPDGRAEVSFAGAVSLVYLDNLRRRIDGGEPIHEAVSAFAGALRHIGDGASDAKSRRKGLRLPLERKDVLEGTDSLHRSVSPELAVCVVWTDPDERSIRFL